MDHGLQKDWPAPPSRWHWKAPGWQPIFVPRGWSTSERNSSSMSSSAPLSSGLFKFSCKRLSYFWLLRIPPTEKEKSQRLIEMARRRFFSDSEFWQCSIAFADIHSTLDEVFRWKRVIFANKHDHILDFHLLSFCWQMFVRLYYVEESDSLMSQMSSRTTSLRQKLISLRQDEVENPPHP